MRQEFYASPYTKLLLSILTDVNSLSKDEQWLTVAGHNLLPLILGEEASCNRMKSGA
jgi:hypothetical protein